MKKLRLVPLTSIIILLLLLLGSLLWRPSLAADFTRGKTLYNAHCAACHGVLGDGNGPQADQYTPRPTDFTSATEMSAVPPDVNEQVVAQGKPGTGMPGFGLILSPEEFQDLIAYQRAFLK